MRQNARQFKRTLLNALKTSDLDFDKLREENGVSESDARKASRITFKILCARAASDGEITAEERGTLLRCGEQLKISERDQHELLTTACETRYREWHDDSLADGVLTNEEIAELHEVRQCLGLPHLDISPEGTSQSKRGHGGVDEPAVSIPVRNRGPFERLLCLFSDDYRQVHSALYPSDSESLPDVFVGTVEVGADGLLGPVSRRRCAYFCHWTTEKHEEWETRTRYETGNDSSGDYNQSPRTESVRVTRERTSAKEVRHGRFRLRGNGPQVTLSLKTTKHLMNPHKTRSSTMASDGSTRRLTHHERILAAQGDRLYYVTEPMNGERKSVNVRFVSDKDPRQLHESLRRSAVVKCLGVAMFFLVALAVAIWGISTPF